MRAIFGTPEIPPLPKKKKKRSSRCLSPRTPAVRVIRGTEIYPRAQRSLKTSHKFNKYRAHSEQFNKERGRELEKERDATEKVRECDRERDVLESPSALWYSLFTDISLSANWPMTEMSQNGLINEPWECLHTHCIRLHVSELCANKLQMETRSGQSNRELLIYTQRQSQSSSSSDLNLKFHLQPPLNSPQTYTFTDLS